MPAGAASEGFARSLSQLMQRHARLPDAAPRHPRVLRRRSRTQCGATPQVETLVRGAPRKHGAGKSHAGAALFQTSVEAFLEDDTLAEEIFGPATLLVTYEHHDELHAVIERLEGQLTATVHAAATEARRGGEAVRCLGAQSRPPDSQRLSRPASKSATRWSMAARIRRRPTVAARASARSPSNGSRDTSPGKYCRMGLPTALQEANPLGIHRLVDGLTSKPEANRP